MEDPQTQPLCDWCGEPFRPPKATGRKPRYCRQSCRQRAYEARRTRREFEELLAYRQRLGLDSSRDETTPAPDSSRDETRATPVPSRDETGVVPVAPVIPAPAVPGPPAVVPPVAPLPAPNPGRRRSNMTASAIPLGVRAELDPRGWLRAFDAFGDDQEQTGDEPGQPTRGA
ncbi:hypothetical protein ACN6AT_39260 (plasmid) [Streptomyces sp. JL4002]|uniref:hypothetical protein n=1 Tax=Streptomyces sp. JL4002 TaxID=3404781 RepID=UPI003B289A95